jgi:hypothetical protein
MFCDEDVMADFWWWVNERQRIWVRRFVRDETPPWTENEILQSYHFCNVHRELDSTTQFALRNVLRGSASRRDVLFNTVLFRFLNHPDSYKAQGGFVPVDDWHADIGLAELMDRDTVFSSAYRITTHDHAGADTKVENIFYGVLRDELQANIDEWVDRVWGAPRMRDAHQQLGRLPGVGDFLAYEILTDLCYRHLPFSEEEWVNIGPGAEGTLQAIFGISFPETLNELHRRQRNWTASYPFLTAERIERAGVVAWPKDHLTLRDLEHACCEYRKFRAIRDDDANKRRFEVGLEGWS